MPENNLIPFEKADGESVEEKLEDLQINLERCLKFITEVAILDGRLITGVAVSTTAVAVNHGLGRALRGWTLVNKSLAQHLHETARSASTLTLQATASMTVDIWVF